MNNIEPIFLIIDLFCGAGGVTEGFERSNMVEVIACVNHDPNAIRSHEANHPNCKHFTEDITKLDVTELCFIADKARKRYPNALLVLWASLECTNFSKAKGGQPRDADSRTLAYHLERYVKALNPDYIPIENVVEFMAWGPLDDNGKPISKRNGEDWNKWRKLIDSYGYRNEWREMNAADYGAYTSRNRLFGIFAKDELPIVWPKPTHSKKPIPGSGLKKWKPVKEVLDFADEGKSIFDRKKPLVEKTLERIYAGLIRHIAGGKDNFLAKTYAVSSNHHGTYNTDNVCHTITTRDAHAIVQPSFISKYFSGHPDSKNKSIDQPLGAITCIDHHSVVNPTFLHSYYGSGDNNRSVELPSPTLTTKDRVAIVQSHFMTKQYGNDKNGQSVNVPSGTITAVPKLNIVSVIGNESLLLNPSWGGHTHSTDAPSPTIVASQHKAPLYLVLTDKGELAIKINESDSHFTRKIKEFMAMYGIVDIKMRMLKISELLKIQGFGEDYTLIGNQGEQKKYIGNSVCPDVVTHWARALAAPFKETQQKVA